MQKFLSFIFSLLIFYFSTGIAFASTQQGRVLAGVEIPRGTTIPIGVAETTNSNKLYLNDIIALVIMDDVFVDGVKVFKKNDTGTAEVSALVQSGSHGRGGFVEIRNAKFKDVYGKTHTVQLNISAKGKNRRASAVTLSVVGVLLIFVPFGFWREGDPATISGGQVFNAVIR